MNYLHPFWFTFWHTEIVVRNPGFGSNIHFVCSKCINAFIKFVFVRHSTNEWSHLSNLSFGKKVVCGNKSIITRMLLAVSQSVLITEIHPVLNQPVGIVNSLCYPLSAGMIAKGTLLSCIGGSICFRKSAIVVIPLRCHDRKHLAALKRHFRYVTVRKYDSTFCWKW